jgi:hypothetical protein
MTVIMSEPFDLELIQQVRVNAQLSVCSYLNRSDPAKFTEERTEKGRLLWRGQIPDLYSIRDTILKAPEDIIPLRLEHEHTRRGEVDIVLTFLLDRTLPLLAHEPLRSAMFPIMSFLNLKLKDFLTPIAPIQILRQQGARGEFESEVFVAVHYRNMLAEELLKPYVNEVARSLFASPDSERLRTALELYGSHFREDDARVRFLLLVMAIESLATPSAKHQVAQRLIIQWRAQLRTEQAQYAPLSPEFAALEALERELLFRRDDSIRSQIRRLVSTCISSKDAEDREIVNKALKVYDLRSTLVHTGHLTATEIEQGESDAREVVEFVLEALTQPRVAQ